MKTLRRRATLSLLVLLLGSAGRAAAQPMDELQTIFGRIEAER